jgi:hypothetical protein
MIATPDEHDCSNPIAVATRLLLAIVQRDQDSYDRAMLALSDCHHCWRQIAIKSLEFQAGEAVHVWGWERAVDEFASEISALVGVGHPGELPQAPDDISEIE